MCNFGVGRGDVDGLSRCFSHCHGAKLPNRNVNNGSTKLEFEFREWIFCLLSFKFTFKFSIKYIVRHFSLSLKKRVLCDSRRRAPCHIQAKASKGSLDHQPAPSKPKFTHKLRVLSRPETSKQPVKAHTLNTTKYKMDSGANFTAAINALVAERDRQFLVRVAQDYNLPFEQLSKLYLEVSADAIKVPRKYTKKPKAVAVVTEEGEPAEPKPAKEPKAKAEKQKCTACTSKKEPCKFSALKGEVFCKRHLRADQEAKGEAPPKEKAAKKPPTKAEQPVHTHALTENAQGECDLCESHGNPLDSTEAEFEVVMGSAGTAPVAPLTVAERLAAILDSADESESDSESEAYADVGGLTEEAFEEDE